MGHYFLQSKTFQSRISALLSVFEAKRLRQIQILAICMVFYQKPISKALNDEVINHSHGLGRVAEWDSMSTPYLKVPNLNSTNALTLALGPRKVSKSPPTSTFTHYTHPTMTKLGTYKIPKIYKSYDTPMLMSAFFTRSQFLLHWGKKLKSAFLYIFCVSFDFYLVF